MLRDAAWIPKAFPLSHWFRNFFGTSPSEKSRGCISQLPSGSPSNIIKYDCLHHHVHWIIGLLSGPKTGNEFPVHGKRMGKIYPMTKNRHPNFLGLVELVESPGLLNLNELDLALLVELLTKLAPDVMNLHEEEQVTRLHRGVCLKMRRKNRVYHQNPCFNSEKKYIYNNITNNSDFGINQ